MRREAAGPPSGQSEAGQLSALYGQQGRALWINRVQRRAMETAALPLGISLPLDQVDATVVTIGPDSVRRTIPAVERSGLGRSDHQAQERTTLYAHGAYVP